jgi:DNA replication protein DnaC
LPFEDTETPPTPHHDNIRGAAYYADPKESTHATGTNPGEDEPDEAIGHGRGPQQQRRSNQYTDLSFEERLGLLIDEEWTAREHRKLTRRLRVAKLRYSSASLENVDFKHRRGLDRSQVLALGSCGWILDYGRLTELVQQFWKARHAW